MVHRIFLGLAIPAAAAAAALSKAKTQKIERDLIACDVCKLAVGELYDGGTDKQRWNLAVGIWNEDLSLEFSGKMCNTDLWQGALWTSVDITTTTDGKGLVVVDMRPEQQFCNEECHMAAKACDTLIVEHEADIATQIDEGVDRDDLIERVCYEWSKVCEPVKLPDGFQAGLYDTPFEELSEEGRAQMKKMLKYKEMQQKTDMGLGSNIARLEGEFINGDWTVKGQIAKAEREAAEEKAKEVAEAAGTEAEL